MIDLKLDPITNDLVIGTDGEFVLTGGVDLIRQRVVYRLRTHAGRWPLDLSMGVDYLGVIFAGGATDEDIRAELLAEITAVPGVTGVDTLEVVRLAGGILNVTFSAETDEGLIAGVVRLGD